MERALPFIDGDIIRFDGHDVARLNPAAWPTLLESFEAALTHRPLVSETDSSTLATNVAEWLKKTLTERASAGLLTVEEALTVIDDALQEDFNNA